MKISLKNIKHSEFASQETNCFEATVYIDGVAKFITNNDGHGGCDNYRALKNGDNPWPEVKRINEILSKQTIKTEWGEMKNSLEIVVSDLLSEHLMKKDLKKMLKKVVMFDAGKIFTFKVLHTTYKQDPSYKAIFAKKYPNAIILNDLPFEEAFKQYKQS